MSDPIELPHIGRIDYVGGSYPMKTRLEGEYVEYDDHVAIVRQLAEQRAELLEALQEIMPAFEGLMADNENVEWHDCWNKAVAAIANATQQRNATGGEG